MHTASRLLGGLFLAGILLASGVSAQTGALDPTFGSGGRVLALDAPTNYDGYHGRTVLRQPDGKYVVAAGYTDVHLARFNADGSLDTSFGTDGWTHSTFGTGVTVTGQAAALDASGRILVIGTAYNLTNQGEHRYRYLVARYTASGVLDTTFGTSGRQFVVVGQTGYYHEATGVAVAPTGEVVVVGYRQDTSSGYHEWVIVRLTSAGALDTGFDGDGVRTVSMTNFITGGAVNYSSQARAVVVQPDGMILVGGYAYNSDPVSGYDTDAVVARFTTTGAFDTGFGSGGVSAVDFDTPSTYGSQDDLYGLALQADGRIAMAAQTYGGYDTTTGETVSDASDIAVARLNANGSLDTGFGMDGVARLDTGAPDDGSYEIAKSVAVDYAGRIVIAGHEQNGDYRWIIARLTASGQPDASFDLDGVVLTSWIGQAGYSSEANGVAVDPDGKIVAAGYAYDPDDGYYPNLALARYVETPTVAGVEVTFRVDARLVHNRLETDTFGLRGSVAPLSWASTTPLADPDGDGYWLATVTFPVSALNAPMEWKVVGMRDGSDQPAWEANPDPDNPPDGNRRLVLTDDGVVSVSYLGSLNDYFANAQPGIDLTYPYNDYGTGYYGYIVDGLEPGEPPVGCGDGSNERTTWYRVTPTANSLLHADAYSIYGDMVAVEVFEGADLASLTSLGCDAYVPVASATGGLAAALGLPPEASRDATPQSPARPDLRAAPPEAATGPAPPPQPRAIPAPAAMPEAPSPEAVRAALAGLDEDYTASVQVSAGAGQTYFVRVTGRAYLTLQDTPPFLAVDPGALDFGPSQVGESSEPLSATLTNTGGTELYIYSNQIVGEGFYISSFPYTVLQEGESVDVDIVFAPQYAQPYAATLSIYSSGGIVTVDLTGEGTGTTTVATTLPGEDRHGNDRGWRYLASPVAGATRADLAADVDRLRNGHLSTWNGSGWEPSGADLPAPGRGFALFLRDHKSAPITSAGLPLDLTGTLLGGPVTVSDLPTTDAFAVLGNPYTDSFDLSYLDLAGAGFHTTVYIFDAETQAYITVTQTDEDDSDVIAPWQGFLAARVTPGEGATALTFDPAGRTGGGILNGLTAGGPASGAAKQAPGTALPLALTVRDASGAVVSHDHATLLFHDDAEAGWDARDAVKLSPLGAWLAFDGERDARPMVQALVARPLPGTPAEIPLRVDGASGDAEIAWAGLSPEALGLPDGWALTLLDRETGLTADLSQPGQYAFSLVSGASSARSDDDDETPPMLEIAALARPSAAARFAVVIGPPPSAPSPGTLALRVGPNPSRDRTTVSVLLPEAGEARVDVFDALGRRVAVLATGPLAAGRHEAELTTGRLSPGVYVVRLETGGRVLTERLTVVR